MLSMFLMVQLAATPNSDIFKVDDFPEFLLESKKSYQIPARILVGLDGNPISCDVEQPSDKRRLDKYTCDILVKRARFAPPKWHDGTPAHGLYRQKISWAFESPTVLGADLDIAVNKLPIGVKTPAQIFLNVDVDTKAVAVSCANAPPWPTPNRSDQAELVRLACGELIKSWKFFVPKDASGQPLRTIQNFAVLIGEEQRE
jgi:hypothetical protein